MRYSAKVDILCHQKHKKNKKNLRIRSFSKMHFYFLKLIKKLGDYFYRVKFFFLNSPHTYLQLCRRHQIDQKIS